MAYEKQNFIDGLPLYAKQLNHIEDGIVELESKRTMGTGVICESSGETIQLDDASDMELTGLKLFGKTTQNGTPTPEAPVPLDSVGADGSVAVKVCGKNLLKNTGSTTSINGVTFTVNDDGSVTANGTATANTFFNINLAMQIEEGKKYILSGCPSHTGLALYGGAYGADTGSGMTFTGFTTASSGLTPNVYIRIASGTTVNNVVVKPMIRLASNTDSTYEPYKGGSVSISTPNGLPGIPVASGGNYTDESGQQWICDEVDFANGKYIQRLVRSRLTSKMNWLYSTSTKRFYVEIANTKADESWKQFIGLCSHYPAKSQNIDVSVSYVNNGVGGVAILDELRFSGDMGAFKAWLDANDVWVLLEAKEQRETALSAEQLAAFAALHSNYPNTTVFTDEGAGMEVKYVADTKLYIDKKFEQLAAALVNNA